MDIRNALAHIQGREGAADRARSLGPMLVAFHDEPASISRRRAVPGIVRANASIRQRLIVGIVTISAIRPILLSASPTPAQAAQPEARRCQTGFLQASPPSSVDECVAADSGTSTAAAPPAGFQRSPGDLPDAG